MRIGFDPKGTIISRLHLNNLIYAHMILCMPAVGGGKCAALSVHAKHAASVKALALDLVVCSHYALTATYMDHRENSG